MKNKDKLTHYLYDNVINQSERKKKKPKDIPNLDKDISSIGIEFLPEFNTASIRVQFFGSKMFFSMPIHNDRLPYWLTVIQEFIPTLEEPNLDDYIVKEEEEEEEEDEFAIVR